MEKRYEKKYHYLEQTHWWFVSRRNIICNLIEKYKKNIKILEIGCSGGELINVINKKGYKNVFGIDKSKDAIKLCIDKNMINIVLMDGIQLGFKDNEFDIIIVSDVLEHIDNDTTAVGEWMRVLKKSGNIINFVPAFNFLWSDHDIVNKHFRRYNKWALRSLFEKSRLRVIRISYWNFILFFPISLIRFLKIITMKSLRSEGQLYNTNKMLNRILSIILIYENFHLRFFNLPIGLSLFLIAEK